MTSGDWTPVEDAQLVHLAKTGQPWSDIAETLLRSYQEIVERAAYLQRTQHQTAPTNHSPNVAPVASGGEVNRVQDDADDVDSPFRATEEDPIQGPVLQVTCRVCPTIFSTRRSDRAFCSVDCAKEAGRERTRLAHQARREAGIHRNDAPRRRLGGLVFDNPAHGAPHVVQYVQPEKPKARKGLCRGHFADMTCILRPRHPSEHLSENGVIFSRGGEMWADTNDAYLAYVLAVDLVAPQE